MEINIGKIIREARMDMNIAQKELAKEIGVTPAALSAWEKNKRNPPAPALIKLANRLGIVDQLFAKHNDKSTSDDEIKKLWKAINKIEQHLK